MRRRLMDCGRQKRLPTKKSRTTESVQTSSSFIHWRLLVVWLLILLVDSMADFRFEYVYPAIMFLRSVYDSYRYQGLIFCLLFICLVVYLDLLCLTVLTGPWLFLGASSCVWLEFMRNTDHSFSYSTLSLWMLFLYVEISHRLLYLPQHLVNVSRPFAAHWRLDKERQERYHQELQEMQERVESRPLLIEQPSLAAARRSAEAKYATALKKAGLSDEQIHTVTTKH